MTLSRFGLLLASLTIVGGLVVACGDDDDGGNTPTTTNDAGSNTSPDGGGNPGENTPDASDSGTADAGDAGGDAGAKGLGQTCAANTECESNVCFIGGTGGGGGGTGGFCSLECTQPNTENVAPCNEHMDVFSGKCNGQRRCQKKN